MSLRMHPLPSGSGEKSRSKPGILKWSKILLACSAATPKYFSNKYCGMLYRAFFWLCCAGTFSLAVIHVTGTWLCVIKQDWIGFLDSVSMTATLFNAAFKTSLLTNELLGALYEKVETYEQAVRRDKESNAIYQGYVNFTSMLARAYTGGSTVTASFLAIASLFVTVEKSDGTKGRKLSTARWYPIDIDEHYPTAFISELSFMYCAFMHFLAVDVLVFSMFLSCIGQFKVVQHRIRNIKSYSKRLASENNISGPSAEMMVSTEIVKLHIKAIDTANEVDVRLKSYFFFEFVVSSIRISVGMINILWRNLALMDYVANFLYLGTFFLETYLYYWNANEITVESSVGIYDAVAMTDYDDLSIPVKKQLVMVLLRANIPSTISIGKLDKLSLDTLLKIMKACYYYVSLLNHFKTDKSALNTQPTAS